MSTDTFTRKVRSCCVEVPLCLAILYLFSENMANGVWTPNASVLGVLLLYCLWTYAPALRRVLGAVRLLATTLYAFATVSFADLTMYHGKHMWLWVAIAAGLYLFSGHLLRAGAPKVTANAGAAA